MVRQFYWAIHVLRSASLASSVSCDQLCSNLLVNQSLQLNVFRFGNQNYVTILGNPFNTM